MQMEMLSRELDTYSAVQESDLGRIYKFGSLYIKTLKATGPNEII